MQGTNSTPAPTGSLPPVASRSEGRLGLGTVLGAIAVVIALIAVALNVVVPGPSGSAGSQGPPGTGYLWAVVSSSGTLIRGSSALNASQTTKGEYQVTFAEDVSSCAYVATVGTIYQSGSEPYAGIAVANSPGDRAAIVVTVTDFTGAAINASFHLAVICGGTPWAVVGSEGSLVRGPDAVLVHENTTGVYTVEFNQNVEDCGILATLGSTSSTPVAAGEITTIPEPNAPDGVEVATYTPAGLAVSESFHVAAVCTGPAWAVIGSTGVAELGNLVSSSESPTGAYQVIFDQNIENCAFVATTGETGTVAYPASLITEAGKAGNVDAVFLTTYTPGGVGASESFSLAVFC